MMMVPVTTCAGTFVHTVAPSASVATPASPTPILSTSAAYRLMKIAVLVIRIQSAGLGESCIDQNPVMGCAMRIARTTMSYVVTLNSVTIEMVIICAGTYAPSGSTPATAVVHTYRRKVMKVAVLSSAAHHMKITAASMD